MQAVGVIGMVAYLSYLVGDYIGLSGIVTLFCCSVTMSHYALHNISKAQRAGTMSAFETLSFLSEGAIFVYVGLDALDPMKWKVTLSYFADQGQHAGRPWSGPRMPWDVCLLPLLNADASAWSDMLYRTGNAHVCLQTCPLWSEV